PNRQVEGVLEVRLRWRDPRQGELVLQALSQAYLDYSLVQRQEKLKQGLAFLDQQAPALQRRVASMQQQLSAFRRQHQFLEPSKKGEAIQTQTQALALRAQDVQQRQAQLLGLAKAVQAGQLSGPSFQEVGRAKGIEVRDPALAGGSFSPLLVDLTTVEKQLAEAEATFSSSAPTVRSLRARRAKLRPLLQQRELDAIRAASAENRAQLLQIERQRQQLAREFADQPALIKQYDSIQQQLDVARENLTSYIKARENFRLEVAQKILPWQLIAPPKFKPWPVSPDFASNLILAMLVGGVAGSGAALLRERLDPLLHSVEDLGKDIKALHLGSIGPLPLASGQPLQAALAALDPQQQHNLREGMRAMATRLRQSLGRQGTHLVGLTASSSGEGTSTATLLLAETLAELGLKVLLIDADLRKPSLHVAAGIDNSSGFSNLLTDASCKASTVIRRLPSGLELITAGPRPRDSTRLLSSELCQEHLLHWSQPSHHDLVLVDMPELMERSDALVLSSLIDCCVLVVGLGVAQGVRLQQVLARLRQGGSTLVGVISCELAPPPSPALAPVLLPDLDALRRALLRS
ncbi:MAG: cellulose synthase operon protein YhjQ/BcsQ, partial [Cyanobacteriota bacterium]|nr:cellulose synthase operon protein YhjQ/BcsQ [Cyanobacteriota bacterium]